MDRRASARGGAVSESQQKGNGVNKARRKSLQKLLDQIQPIEAVIEELKYDIEALKDEEEEYLAAMPSSIGESARGEAANVAIEALEDAIGLLEEIQADVVEAAQKVEEAMA
ncbi:prefoldin subunit 5 [Rhizobium sp. BK591]|uniref:hypothetical protein n=1 Tax=Rhizobium sp. BK591 TaxID=2586985 RepID=UPI0017E56D6B|nr:hypothetical protein [Rhizobium sp. BK591]MBB3743511.1 prefoldin subunit 5 [Rhizobium sp. BK591]